MPNIVKLIIISYKLYDIIELYDTLKLYDIINAIMINQLNYNLIIYHFWWQSILVGVADWR